MGVEAVGEVTGFDLRGAINPIHAELGESLSSGVDALMVDLTSAFSESPEAWRGAGTVAFEMLSMMRYLMGQADENGVSIESASTMIIAIQSAVFRTLVEHPAVKAAM